MIKYVIQYGDQGYFWNEEDNRIENSITSGANDIIVKIALYGPVTWGIGEKGGWIIWNAQVKKSTEILALFPKPPATKPLNGGTLIVGRAINGKVMAFHGNIDDSMLEGICELSELSCWFLTLPDSKIPSRQNLLMSRQKASMDSQ